MKVSSVRTFANGKPSQQFLFVSHLRLGCLSSSIHGTRRIGTELAINLQLFTKAYYASSHHCLSSELFPCIEYMKSGKITVNKHRLSNDSICKQDLNSLQSFIQIEGEIKLMKSSEYLVSIFEDNHVHCFRGGIDSSPSIIHFLF